VDIEGIGAGLSPGARIVLTMRRASGEVLELVCRARLDSTVDVEYFANGGVLPRVLRLKLAE
jgi:aconitate hydratase